MSFQYSQAHEYDYSYHPIMSNNSNSSINTIVSTNSPSIYPLTPAGSPHLTTPPIILPTPVSDKPDKLLLTNAHNMGNSIQYNNHSSSNNYIPLVRGVAPPKRTKDGKYCCSMCERSYTHAKHLKRHMMRHTGERPYGCDWCLSRFTRPDIRKRHAEKCKAKKAYMEKDLEQFQFYQHQSALKFKTIASKTNNNNTTTVNTTAANINTNTNNDQGYMTPMDGSTFITYPSSTPGIHYQSYVNTNMLNGLEPQLLPPPPPPPHSHPYPHAAATYGLGVFVPSRV